MNRWDVIRRIQKQARRDDKTWSLVKHGRRHDLYDLDGVMIPIPRHTEISEQMAQIIWKECESGLGKGWWRR